MKKRHLFIVLPCMIALLFALVGCSGDKPSQSTSDAEAESLAAFTGTWDLVRSNDGTREVGKSELDQLRERGMNVYLSLEDGSYAVLNLFGDERVGTWTPKNATEATLTFDGEDIPMTITDETLSLTEGYNELAFEKRVEEEVTEEVTDETAEVVEGADGETTEVVDETATAVDETTGTTETTEDAIQIVQQPIDEGTETTETVEGVTAD